MDATVRAGVNICPLQRGHNSLGILQSASPVFPTGLILNRRSISIFMHARNISARAGRRHNAQKSRKSASGFMWILFSARRGLISSDTYAHNTISPPRIARTGMKQKMEGAKTFFHTYAGRCSFQTLPTKILLFPDVIFVVPHKYEGIFPHAAMNINEYFLFFYSRACTRINNI